MGRIAGFLFGLLVGLVVFGVGALVFLPREARIESNKLEVPLIANVGLIGDALVGKAVPEVFFEGNVEVSPQVAAEIRNAKLVTATIDITQVVTGVGRNGIGRVIIDNPKFPLHYSLPWTRAAVVNRIDKVNLESFDVEALICVGQNPGQCYPLTLPRYGGRSKITPVLKGTIASQPPGSPVKLDAGTMVANLYQAPVDIVACVNSGYSITGMVKPTASFLAKAGASPRIAILMHPLRNLGVKEPFVNPVSDQLRPVTAADMNDAAASGISFTFVTLAGAAGAPFTLKISPGNELAKGTFVAVLCKPREPDLDCAARFYPALRSYALSYGDAGIYALSPKDFHVPSCGDKTVFYLNDWKLPPGSAGIDAYRKANPPEVVDGATL